MRRLVDLQFNVFPGQVFQLREMGVSDELLADFVLQDVEYRITELLKQIPAEEVCNVNAFGREQAMSLCNSILEASVHHALLEQVSESAKLLKGLLQDSDVTSLAEAIETIEKSAHGADEHADEAQDQAGIVAFLKLHKIGMALMADAVTRKKAGQHQLEGELRVANLQDLLTDVERLQPPWGVSGLEKALVPFWQERASGRDDSTYLHKHRLLLEMMSRESFAHVTKGVQAECKNTLSGCLEVLFELWEAESKDQPQEAQDADAGQGNMGSISLEEILDKIRLQEYFCHAFWKQVAGKMPDSLSKLLEDYKQKSLQFCDLVQYAFASRGVLPDLKKTTPSPDMLRAWGDELVPSMKEYLDSGDVFAKCDSIFACVARQDLQHQTLSCFADVGKVVAGVFSSALTSMPALAASFSEVLNFEPQAKLSLPQQGDWALVLNRFFEAPVNAAAYHI